MEVRDTLPQQEEQSDEERVRYEAKSSGKITWARNETGRIRAPDDTM